MNVWIIQYINREEDTGAEGLKKGKAFLPPGIYGRKRKSHR